MRDIKGNIFMKHDITGHKIFYYQFNMPTSCVKYMYASIIKFIF